MLIPVHTPSTVLIFYSKIFEIVQFDALEEVLKIDKLIEWVFNFNQDHFREDVK